MLGPGAPSVAGMVVTIGANTAGASAGLGTLSQQMNGVAKGGMGMASGLNQAAGIASTAIVGIGVSSVKAAMTFEQSMRNVNSIALLSEDAFQKVQDDVIAFSLTTRSPAENVAESLYKVVSAGYSLDEALKPAVYRGEQTSEAMAVMMAASRAAGAGLADVTDVIGVLIPTLKAYDMSVNDSEYITDIFLQTVQSGIVTLPQLAGVLGRITPLAANLGVPVEELGYAFANMTNTGLTAEQAGTRIQAMLTQLMKPSDDLKDVIEKLGYASGTQLVKAAGGLIPAIDKITSTVFESTVTIGGMNKAQTKMSLQYPFMVEQMGIYEQELAKIVEKEGEGSLAAQKKRLAMDKLSSRMGEYKKELDKTTPAQQKLVKEFFGTNEGIAELFRNVRAIGGVMALTADETTMSAEAFAKWKEGIKDSVEQARVEQYKSFETQVKRLKVAFNVLGIEIGLTLIPPLTQLIDKVIVPLVRSFLPPLRTLLDGVAASIEKLPGPVQGLVTAFLALAFALKGASYTLRPFLGMLGFDVSKLSALAGPLGVLAVAVGAFGVAYNQNLFGLKDATDKFVDNFKTNWEGVKTYLKDVSETNNTTISSLYALPEALQKPVYSFAVMRQALGKIVKEGMTLDEWLASLDGSLSPVMAGIVSFAAGISDVLRGSNQVLVDNTQAMKDDIKDFFSTGFSDWSGFKASFEGISQIVSDTFSKLFNHIKTWVSERAPDIRNAFYKWAENAITWVTTFAANVIPSLADAIGAIVEWIVGTGVPTLIGAGMMLFQNLAKGFSEGSKGQIFFDKLLAEAILPGIERIRNSVNEAGAILAQHLYEGFRNALVKAFGETKADAIIAGISQAVQTAMDQLETIFKPTFFRISVAAQNFGDDLREKVGPAIDRFKEALAGLAGPASIIGKVLAGVAVIVGKVFGELIGQALQRLPEIIAGVIDLFTNAVKGFSTAVTGIADIFKAVFAGDWPAALDAAKSAFGEFVSYFWTQIGALLVIADQVVGGIYDAIVNTINDLTGATLPSWAEFKNGIVTKFNEIEAAITGKIDAIKSKVDEIITALSPVIEFIKGIFDDVKAGFQEFVNELGPIGEAVAPVKEAFSGMMEGIKEAFDTLKEVLGTPEVKAFGDKLLALGGIIVGVLGAGFVSTLTVLGEILSGVFRNGATIIQGFGQVIAGIFDVIKSIFLSFSSVVKAIFSGDMQAANEAGLRAFEAFKEGIKKIFEGIGNMLIGAFGTIYDTISGIMNKIPGITLPTWEELTKGFEFGADKVKTSGDAVAGVFSGMSTSVANSASGASSAVGGAMTAITGSTDTAASNIAGFSGSVETSLSGAAGSATTYSGQMASAIDSMSQDAILAQAQAEAFYGGMMTAAQNAKTETETATTGLFDAIIGKMNSLAGEVVGPQQTFTDLQTTVSGASSAVQTDLGNLQQTWNTTWTDMAKTPVVAGDAVTKGWQTGIANLPAQTTQTMDQVNVAAQTGFGTVNTTATTALTTLNTTATTQMAALNTTVSSGLTTMQTGYTANYTALATADQTYQTNATLGLQTFVTTQLAAWSGMSVGVQGQALLMTTTVQARFAEFYMWLSSFLTVLLVPAVTLAFDLMYASIVQQMAAAASAMESGWLSMLGGTRSKMGELRGAVGSEMSALVGELRGYAGEMMGVGQAIGSGLAAGISSMIGAAVAAAVALVNAAIAAAWAAAAAHSPSRIMMDLGRFFGLGFSLGVEKEGPGAAGAASSVIEGAIQSAKEAAGIRSPSDEMQIVGWDFVNGLLKGISDKEAAAVTKVAEVIDKIMGAISNALKALSELAAFTPKPINLTAFKDQIKEVVMGLQSLAGFFSGGNEIKLTSAKAVLEPVSEVFSKLSSVVSGLKSVFELADIDATVADGQRAMAMIVSLVKTMVTSLAAAANELKDVAWPKAVALSAVAGQIAGNVKAIIETIQALNALIPGSPDRLIAPITSFAVALVNAFAAAGADIEKETSEAAQQFAALAESVTGPIKEAVDAIAAMTVLTVLKAEKARIGAELLVANLVDLASRMAEAMSGFSKETQKKIAEAAAMFKTVAEPWKAAIEAVDALSKFLSVRIEGATDSIVAAVSYLAEKLAGVTDDLGPELMARAEAGASLFAKVLDPWQKAVETLRLVVTYTFRPVGAIASQIAGRVQALSWVLAWFSDQIGPDLEEDSKRGAALMASLLDPWQKAIETLKALTEYFFVPIGKIAAQIAGRVEALSWVLAGLESRIGEDLAQKAKRGAEIMASLLDPWKEAIETLVAISGYVFRPVGKIANTIVGPVLGLAVKLGKLSDKISTGLKERAARGAAAMMEVVEPWESAIQALGALAGFVFRPVGKIANSIVSAVEGLAIKLARIPDILKDQAAKAAAGATMMMAIVAPWEEAVKALETLADFVFSPIGDVANKIVGSVMYMALILAQLVGLLNPVINLAKEGALLMAAIMEPWQNAVETLDAMADFAFRPINAIANKIVGAVWYMATILSQLVSILGADLMNRAKEGAKLMAEIMTPWKDAIETLGAVAAYVARNIEAKAKNVGEGVGILAKVLSEMGDTIGMGTLAKAAKVGKLLSSVLEPWEKAMKIADDMRAFAIMPDFVDKMTRFGKQWANVIEELGKIVRNISQDAMDAVKAFSDVLEALVGSLSAAMDLMMQSSWPEPDAGVWDSFMAWVWDIFQFFYNKVQDLLNDPNNTLGFDPVDKFATTIESIMSALSAAIEVARNFEFVMPDPEIWRTFTNWVWGIFQFFYAKVQELLSDPKNTLGFDPVEQFANALSSILTALSAALDIARNFEFVMPDPEIWATFRMWVWGIFQFFYTMVETLRTDSRQVLDFSPEESFGNALSSILGALQVALEVARNFQFTLPDATMWDNFRTWVWGVFRFFYDLVESLRTDPRQTLNFDPEESFGSALESIMGGLQAALQLVTGFVFEAPDGTEWDAFIAWVVLTFSTIRTYIQTLVTDPTTAINFDPEVSFGEALESIMGGLLATLELINNFVWTPPDPVLWDDFIGWVLGFMETLRQRILEEFPDTVANAQYFAPVQALATAIEAVSGGLQGALELFEALHGYIPPANTTIDTFLTNVGYLLTMVITYTTNNITPARVAALRQFSDAMQAISDGLGGALDLFEGLASLDDRTIDWLANAGAGTGTNTGAAMQVIGYLFQAIVQTMTRFQTEVATRLPADWRPTATAFFNAMSEVIGILQDALDLFTDLGTSGMPSTAEIEAFVQAIMQVFTTFNTGLGSVVTPLHATVLSIQNELSTNLAGWLVYNSGLEVGRMFYDAGRSVTVAVGSGIASTGATQAAIDMRQQVVDAVHGWFSYHAAAVSGRIFYEDGRNVVLSLCAGMLSEEDYAYQTAYDIGQAVINGLNAGIAAGSPSRLAIESGSNVSIGMALGILAGKDQAVDAAYSVAEAVIAAYDSVPETVNDRPTPLWPSLSATSGVFSGPPVTEHEVTIRVEGGDRLPKMTDYEMREFARMLSDHLKTGG